MTQDDKIAASISPTIVEKLREEGSLSSLGHTSEAFRSRSSLAMSLVDNYDSQICDQHFPSQEPLEAEKVMVTG